MGNAMGVSLAAMLSSSTKKRSDLYALVYLLSNTIVLQHDNVKFGVGDSIQIKAIGEAQGTSNDFMKKRYEREGNLGNVAMNAKGGPTTLVGFGTVLGKKGSLGGGGSREQFGWGQRRLWRRCSAQRDGEKEHHLFDNDFDDNRNRRAEEEEEEGGGGRRTEEHVCDEANYPWLVNSGTTCQQ
jgi:hypothetical protein